MRRAFHYVALLSLLTACAPSHVYIVRHAERANDTDTTSLSAAGLARAEALAAQLAGVRIDSVFVTPYTRTRQTAALLARQRGLPLTEYAIRPTDLIVSRLRRLRGQHVVVVGHSNTILEIARGLGTTPALTTIAHTDYDNLLHVRIRPTPIGQRAQLRVLTYGQPTR